jgi:alpha-beta hydrolase superfamily lysophospholipase
MYNLRTRFKKDIVCEFLPPKKDTGEVVIICGGMPSYTSNKDLVEFFSKKGFWTFMPRYGGTWESGGEFLKESPHKDIIYILDQLPKGFVSLWDNKKYKVNPKQIFLIGSSFGGPAVLLASSDPRVTKSIALSPVIDWKKESRTEPMDFIEKFVRSAFGNAYRFTAVNWKKLKSGNFYSPIREAKNLDGNKIMIIQALDDEVVPLAPIKDFVKITKCQSVFIKKGGHLSVSLFMKDKKFSKIFKDFTKK